MQTNPLLMFGFSPEEFKQLLREVVREELQANSQTPEEKLISAAELCKKLGISKTTLWSWVNDGKIKQYKIGSRNFYKFSEIVKSASNLKKYARLEMAAK